VAHFRRNAGIGPARVAGPVTLSRLGVYRPGCRIATPLALGDYGPPVWCLRRFLVGRGIEVSLDGKYTDRVAKAVRTVEARRGLRVDGAADATFLRAIGAWPSA
jgi:Putative peptidoglycan binding domain